MSKTDEFAVSIDQVKGIDIALDKRPIAVEFNQEPTAAPLMAEACKTIDPVLLVELVPGSDRVIVEKQHLGYGFATHAVVQQHQRIRAPRQPVSGRAIPRQLDQIAARFAVVGLR
jgi:hypothetical protein